MNAQSRCAVDVHADPARGGRVLARGPELPPEPAALVGERDRDHDERADRRLQRPRRLGHQRERRRARADLRPTRAGCCA